MALRKIVTEGDPALSRVCRPVEIIDKKILTLIGDMRDTLAKANGLGLAAPQVGINRRLCIVLDDDETPMALINPEIIASSGEQEFTEGCLSLPKVWGKTKRPTEVTVKALNENGEEITITRTGTTAVCLCHEIDHLNGILFRAHVTEYIEYEDDDD